MTELLSYLLTGIIFGISAGITPGPLLTLMVSETLKFGTKEGIKIALVPALIDAPIILITIFLLSKLSNFNIILGVISLTGGLLLVYLAYESIILKINLKPQNVKANSLRKGIVVNLLNPHPYLFWLFIGGPLVIGGYKISIINSVIFILGFYIFIVGSKITIVFALEKSKNFLNSKTYSYAIKFLGFILLLFSIIFFFDAIKYFRKI